MSSPKSSAGPSGTKRASGERNQSQTRSWSPTRDRSSDRLRDRARNLTETMREPSTTVPPVVVLEETPADTQPKVVMDPKRDLWVSTVDGRYQSPIIPVRCGPDEEIFWVHKDILRKSEWFRKALDGEFRESYDQMIDLPEENPVAFSFLIAYLYEDKFQPIQPAFNAMTAQPPKGKEKEIEHEESATNSGSSSDSSISGSDNSARSALRARRAQRRREQEWNERNRKQPGQHRPDCNCSTCTVALRGVSCANCGMIRTAGPAAPQHRLPVWYPPYGGPPPMPHVYNRHPPPPPPAGRRRRHGAPAPYVSEIVEEPRMTEEDLRSWLMAYELSVDVYICADRYLMDELKKCVAKTIEDQLETAGMDAAEPRVLHCCKKLHDALPENDVLLRKVFARVGFMLPRLQKDFQPETQNFWMENPEVNWAIMKETMERRERDYPDQLPAMDSFPVARPPPPPGYNRDRHRRY